MNVLGCGTVHVKTHTTMCGSRMCSMQYRKGLTDNSDRTTIITDVPSSCPLTYPRPSCRFTLSSTTQSSVPFLHPGYGAVAGRIPARCSVHTSARSVQQPAGIALGLALTQPHGSSPPGDTRASLPGGAHASFWMGYPHVGLTWCRQTHSGAPVRAVGVKRGSGQAQHRDHVHGARGVSSSGTSPAGSVLP